MNFQMFKLVLEKAEEPEIKLPISAGSSKKQSFPEFLVVHAVKGFGIVNKAEGDVFLELFSFFYDPKDVGNLISGSSAFSKSSLNIWSQVNSDPEDKQHYSQPVLQVLSCNHCGC